MSVCVCVCVCLCEYDRSVTLSERVGGLRKLNDGCLKKR